MELLEVLKMMMLRTLVGAGIVGLGAGCANKSETGPESDTGHHSDDSNDDGDSGDGGDSAPWSFSAELATDAGAWTPLLADYPEVQHDDLEFVSEDRTLELRDGSEASGLYHYVNNISDDVFTSVWRPVDIPDGLTAFHIDLTLATNTPGGCDAGGGASVLVKVGLLAEEPTTTVEEDGWVRTVFDHGQQAATVPAFPALGWLKNDFEDCVGNDWGVVTLSTETPIEVTPDGGTLNLFLATESAFEGFHEVLYVDVELRAAE